MRHTVVAALLAVVTGLAAVVVPASPVAGAPSLIDQHSPNISAVGHLAWTGGTWSGPGGGSDIEFRDLDVTGLPGVPLGVTGVRRFAFGGTLGRGLQIVDVTTPSAPVLATRYDCRVSQGDIQLFSRGAKTYVTYAADYSVNLGSRCYTDLVGHGIPVGNGLGSVIVDVSNPYVPRTVSFMPEPQGTHNLTVHPSGNFLYNSNSDFFQNGTLEWFDIRGSLIRHPVKLGDLPLPKGSDSHDITFSADGTRAYSAALNHTVIIDTSDPAAPVVIGQLRDPAIQIHHQADPITVTDPELGTRTLLIVTDEVNGGGPAACPGGGLHVYDITGPRERRPVKLGVWKISATDPNDGQRGCTAHVLRMHPEQGIMTIGWYRKGVRVLDITGLASVTAGQVETPIREIGYYAFSDADTWVAKTPEIEPDGSFFLFANDINRGLDVFRFDASAAESTDPGQWTTAAQSAAEAAARGPVTLQPSPLASYCLVTPWATG
jgi:hypothetical protein